MPVLSDEELARRAADLEWILCDVDGVLTDGGLHFGRSRAPSVRFDVKDGLGLELAQRAGLKVGLLTARASRPVDRRAAGLGLDLVMSGISDKAARFRKFLADERTEARRVAYIGDDLTDLVVLGRCGLGFAPADAVAEVQAVAHRVLAAPGGRGAAREMVELLLKARGDWEAILAPFSFET